MYKEVAAILAMGLVFLIMHLWIKFTQWWYHGRSKSEKEDGN